MPTLVLHVNEKIFAIELLDLNISLPALLSKKIPNFSLDRTIMSTEEKFTCPFKINNKHEVWVANIFRKHNTDEIYNLYLRIDHRLTTRRGNIETDFPTTCGGDPMVDNLSSIRDEVDHDSHSFGSSI